MSSEIPEYVTGFERYEEVPGPDGQMIIQERRIPASEIREQWFQQGMRNITNTAVKESTAPTARKRVSQELRATIGPAAYAQLLAYNRTAAKKERLAILDAAIQKGIVNGDRIGVEAVLERGRLTGEISQADYHVRQLKASQDLDIEAYSQDIMSASNLGELETTQDQLSLNVSRTMPGDSDMTAAQRNTLRATAEATRAHMIKEREEVHRETEQEGFAKLVDGSLTDRWLSVQTQTDQMDRAAAMSLRNALKDDRRASNIIDDLKVANWKRDIQRRMMNTDFGVQTSDVAKSINHEILTEPGLNGAEAQQAFDYVRKVEKEIRDNPEYKQALFALKLVTGMPEADQMAVVNALKAAGVYGDTLKLTEDFSNALYQYIDEFGAEARPLEFVQKNKDKYTLESNKTTTRDRFSTSYPELVPPIPQVPDPKVILHNLYNDYLSGGSTSEELEETIAEVYTFWYGTPLDIGNL